MKTKCPPKPLLNLNEAEHDWWRRINMECFNTYTPRPVRRMGPKIDERSTQVCIEDWCLGGCDVWDFPEIAQRPWDIPDPFTPETSR